MLSSCVKRVRNGFENLDTLQEKIAGPVCLTLGPICLLVGNICFFDVVAPSLPYPIISIPICVLVTLNMCMHYIYAITVSPGFLDDPPRDFGDNFLRARDLDKGEKTIRGASWPEKGVKITPAATTQCQKCNKIRPERTHHCHLCNKCVLKYDHHCPVRINQCVGLHNERHFVLFMVYVILATLILLMTGYQEFIHALVHHFGLSFRKWEHNFSEYWFLQAYMCSAVICFAISVVLGHVLCGVVYGETMGESKDNEEYRKEAKGRNEEFINSYDCGKWKNLLFFFNIEGGYSILALFLPLRLNPYTDGFSWARKNGCEKYPSFRKAKPRETIMTKLYKLFHSIFN